MSGAPQVAMRYASQSWQIFFPSQTLQVICFSFAKPSNFLFGPSQKGTICSSACASHALVKLQIISQSLWQKMKKYISMCLHSLVATLSMRFIYSS
jgi:hypothetical protein